MKRLLYIKSKLNAANKNGLQFLTEFDALSGDGRMDGRTHPLIEMHLKTLGVSKAQVAKAERLRLCYLNDIQMLF